MFKKNKEKLLGEIKFLSEFIFKNKGKDFIIYFGSSLLVSGIGFLLLPLFTHAMTPYEMGVYGTFVTIKSFILQLLVYGTNTILTTKYYKLNKLKRKELLSNIIYFISILSIISFLFILMFVDFLSSLIKVNSNFIFFSFIIGYFDAVLANFMKIYQLKSLSKKYALVSVLKTLGIISFSLVFVFMFKFTLYGRVLGVFIPSVLVPAIILFNYRDFLVKINFAILKQILITGYSYVLSGISVFVVNMSDKIFINNLVSVDETGIYTVGYKFGQAIRLIHTSFSRAWVSYFYKNVYKKRKKVLKLQFYYLFVLLVIVIIFNLVTKIMFDFFISNQYSGGYIYVIIISVAYYFDAIKEIFKSYLVYFERHRLIRNIAIFESLFNLILNYLLIKRFGGVGAAIATLISFSIGALITIIFVYVNYEEGFESIENTKKDHKRDS